MIGWKNCKKNWKNTRRYKNIGSWWRCRVCYELLTRILQPHAFLLETAIHSHSCPFRLRLRAIDVVEYLISIISPEAVNIQNDQGNTALHWAATNGHAKVVETLINKGKADYKVQNRSSSLK